MDKNMQEVFKKNTEKDMEFLCRAKGKDWKEYPTEERWVEGYPVKKTHLDAKTEGKFGFIKCSEIVLLNYLSDVGYTAYPIDEYTLCRGVGLEDKSHKPMFENDVVQIDGEDGYFIVEWNQSEARWQLSNESERYIVDFDNFWNYQMEVVGNTLDNPELFFDPEQEEQEELDE